MSEVIPYARLLDVLNFFEMGKLPEEMDGVKLKQVEGEFFIDELMYNRLKEIALINGFGKVPYASLTSELELYCESIKVPYEIVIYMAESDVIWFDYEPFSNEPWVSEREIQKLKTFLGAYNHSGNSKFLPVELEGITSMEAWLWLNRIFKGKHKGYPVNEVMQVTETEMSTLRVLLSDLTVLPKEHSLHAMIKDVPNGKYYRLENGTVWVPKYVFDFFAETYKKEVVNEFSSSDMKISLKDACTYLCHEGIRKYDLERSVLSGVLTPDETGKVTVGFATKIKELYNRGYNLTESVAIASGIVSEKQLNNYEVLTKNVLMKVLNAMKKRKVISANKIGRLFKNNNVGVSIGTSFNKVYPLENVHTFLHQFVREIGFGNEFEDVYNTTYVLEVLKYLPDKFNETELEILRRCGYRLNFGRWVFSVYGSSTYVDSETYLVVRASDLPEKLVKVLNKKDKLELERIKKVFEKELLTYAGSLKPNRKGD